MGCAVLIVLGVLFEVIGLGLVAWQLWRVQQREFGMPAWWVQVRHRLRRGAGRSGTSQTVSIGAAGEINTAGEIRPAQGRRGPPGTVEWRLDTLDAELAALKQETQTRLERHEQRQNEMRGALRKAEAELRHQQEEREGERRVQLRESMTLQWWGTGQFFIGAVLAGVANGVC